MAPGPDVDDHIVQADAEVPDLLDRHRAAVGNVCRADRLVVAQQRADDRAQAVGGDDDLGGVAPAFADRPRAAGDLLYPGDLAGRDKIDPEPLRRAQQRAMQVAAVNDNVGEAIPRAGSARSSLVSSVPSRASRMMMLSGVTPREMTSSSRPQSARMRVQLGAICRPAPTSPNSGASSSTRTFSPACVSATALLRPPIPPPDDDDVGARGLLHEIVLFSTRCPAITARPAVRGRPCRQSS